MFLPVGLQAKATKGNPIYQLWIIQRINIWVSANFDVLLKLEAPKNSISVLSTLRIRVHPPKCVHLPCHSEKALRPLQVGQWFLGFPVQMTSAQPAYSHIGLLWNDFGMYQENIKPAMSKVVFREWAPMNSWKQTLQSMPYAFSSATARKRVLQTGCCCFFRAWNLQPTSENVSGGLPLQWSTFVSQGCRFSQPGLQHFSPKLS